MANHGWNNRDIDVYHDDNVIGSIRTRFDYQDWALVELTSDIQFTNADYFGAPVPHHLLRCRDIKKYVTPISYFAHDRFTTGIVWLNYAGLVYRKDRESIIEMKSDFAYIFRKLRGTADELAHISAAGLCRSPVVHQEITDHLLSNSVCGFFWLSDLQLLWVVAVDPLIQASWEIVKQ